MGAQEVGEGSYAAFLDDDEIHRVNDLAAGEIDEDLGGDAVPFDEQRPRGAGARTRSFDRALIELADRCLPSPLGVYHR